MTRANVKNMNNDSKWRDENVSLAANTSQMLPAHGDFDPLWTPEQAAQRLNVSPDWVRDHSSRKEPRLPVIRLGGGPGRAGLLRYRASAIENFIEEQEQLSARRRRSI